MLLSPQNYLEPKDSFKVYARVRPFTQNQAQLQPSRPFFTHDLTSISLKTRNFQQTFDFDHIFGSESQQKQVFDLLSKDIIDNAFKGINGSIFCYGQTCSGKTHTIVGDYGSKSLQNQGLMPRILKEIITRKDSKIDDAKSSKLDIRIKISMIQIYNEKIFDLLDLSRKDLRLRQNKKQGVFVENLTERYINSVEQAMNFVFTGLENRTQGRTNENTFSSRSHMIFAISIVETDFERKEAKSSRITLIDLAGSERLTKTGVEGKMLLQTKNINTSLSTLGKVIKALSEGKKKHVPYRDSKLTRLLKQSIGGNCLTRLIINLAPSYINESETVSALRFGSTAKLIKNRPRINKEYTVEELLDMLEKAQMKIKQLTKFISEIQRKGISQSCLPKDFFEMKAIVAQIISLHLVDDNDEESDERVSVEGSKVSSLNESSQYLSHDGSGVFSPFGMDLDVESPQRKKQMGRSMITSSQSMKLLPFSESPQNSIFNPTNQKRQTTRKQMRVSAFVENQEEDHSQIHSHESRRKIVNFNDQDFNNIFGEGPSLRKNTSVNVEQKLDFSVKSIHESVEQIRQRCLKKMGMAKEANVENVNSPKNQNNKNAGEFRRQQSQINPKKLSIISCLSLNFGGQPSQQTSKQKDSQVDQVDQSTLNHIHSNNNSPTQSTIQKLQQSASMLQSKPVQYFKAKKFETQKANSLLIAQLIEGNSLNVSNGKPCEEHLSQLQKYKKIIKEQNEYIVEIKKREINRRSSLSQDIDKLKLVISCKSPRSSLSAIQNFAHSQTAFDQV